MTGEREAEVVRERLTVAEQRAEREAARLMAEHSCPQCRRVEARKRRAALHREAGA